MEDRPIRITSIAEKWRLECPNGEIGEGHTNWFPIDGVFRCEGCVEQRRTDPTVDPQYTHLRDKKTGELVAREDIVLAIDRQPSATGV